MNGINYIDWSSVIQTNITVSTSSGLHSSKLKTVASNMQTLEILLSVTEKLFKETKMKLQLIWRHNDMIARGFHFKFLQLKTLKYFTWCQCSPTELYDLVQFYDFLSALNHHASKLEKWATSPALLGMMH